MVSARALFGTALGLTLASCAMGGGESPVASDTVAATNRAAAASVSPFSAMRASRGPGVQVASLEGAGGGQTVADVSPNPPVVQKGTVLWRRSGDEADLPPTPKVGEELRRLRESIAQMKGQTSLQLTSLEDRLQTSQKTLSQVQDDQARAERDLRAQTTEAVSNVAAMAQESMRSMERVARNTSDRWFATNQQLTSLETRLQTAIAENRQTQLRADAKTQAYTDLKVSQASLETQLAAVREARQAAMEAELRAKSFTGQQLAGRDQALGSLIAANQVTREATEAKLNNVQAMQSLQYTALSNQLEGNRQQTAAQLDSLKSETATRLAAAQDVQNAQLASVSSQLASNQKLTEWQLAQIRKLSEDNRALASSETANVAAALRQYADAQFQQAEAANKAAIGHVAQATSQNVDYLRQQTNQRLGVLWQAANRNAEKLAEEKANSVAASLAALQQQVASERLAPTQIRAIAEQTVADATPEFRALALQTMQEGQDYIRTVARNAVQDKDPAMTTALADAARDVITRDDKVVFAIRKAVAEELQGLATAADTSATAAGAATRLGPDRGLALLNGEEALDPNRIRIAQLLAPGTNRPAPDSVAIPGGLAAISPAAGEAPQTAAVSGPQSWSTPGASLSRARNRADWMDIRQYKVVVHDDNRTLEELLSSVLKRAEPFTGPWQVRWKISDPNRDIMSEKFSLDAETSFEEFVSYLAQYVVNDRGVKLSFSLFDNERIIVISD